MQDITGIIIAIMVIVLVYFIFFIVIVNRKSNKMVDKFNNFALSNRKERKSILDSFNEVIWKLLNVFSDFMKKSKILTLWGAKYDKYISYDESQRVEGIDLLALKILSFLISFIVLMFLYMKTIITIPYLAIIALSVLFFSVPDILWDVKYSTKKSAILEEVLNSITVLKNSLCEGNSIYISINKVIKENENAIGDEFKKVLSDLNYGLTLSQAFNRFSSRTGIYIVEEISSILELFGDSCDYKEVFIYLEKRLYSKYSLKNDLNISTVVPKFIFRFLTLISFSFLIFSIFFKKIFQLYYMSSYGLFFIIVFVLIYVLYGYVFYRVLEVEL